jgi:hypothetical protein
LKQITTPVLWYKGSLTFERIGILLNDLKSRKDSFGIDPVLYKKLLTLMIEVLENVLRYSDNFNEYVVEQPEYLPEFKLNLDEEDIVMVARNPVRNKDRQRLKEKIDLINSSTGDQLKKIYRETITNGIFSEKGGAGLGFIEMAKIASRNLEFSFRPATDGFSIYELKIHVNITEP